MAFHQPRGIFGTGLRLRKHYYEETIRVLEGELNSLEEKYQQAARDISDPEYLEVLAEEGGTTVAFLRETSEMLLVSTYHWVEKKLKVLLRWAPEADSAGAEQLNFPAIKERFHSSGIRLESIQSYNSVDTLRVFANSWKHQPNRPSQALVSKLRLDEHVDLHGLLSCRPVFLGLQRVVDVAGADAAGFELVRSFLDECVRFLQGVRSEARFLPDWM